MYEDVSSQPIIGPALLVNGQLLKWEGPPLSSGNELSALSKPAATQSESTLNKVQSHQSTASLRDIDRTKVNFHNTPIEFRLNFDSDTGIKAVSNIELENCGTAAVYYNWQVRPLYQSVSVISYRPSHICNSPFPSPIHWELFRQAMLKGFTLTPEEVCYSANRLSVFVFDDNCYLC